MFIFDQLKRDDRQLRTISVIVATGMLILLTGLWFVQIVRAKKFERSSERQSYRSVRIAPIRGRIFDRNGRVLAENQPRFAINVYLEELRDQFYFEYTNRILPAYIAAHPEVKKEAKVGLLQRVAIAIGLQSPAKMRTSIPLATKNELQQFASFVVVSNLASQIGTILNTNVALEWKKFQKHYIENRYVPFPIISNLDKKQVAIYAERLSDSQDVELDVQSVRKYPNGTRAAHLVGYCQATDPPDEEKQSYTYYVPDFEGKVGVEHAYDSILRGDPGTKWIIINSMRYRQREAHTDPSEPGTNIYLTIDSNLQRDVERVMSPYHGAAIVMDINNGEVLAMASAPAFDPNVWVNGISKTEWEQLDDKIRMPMFNRATAGAYNPGSTFKIVTALACLESGLNPDELMYLPGYYQASKHARPIGDTAKAGDYDLKRAFYKSSNTYFITNGLRYAGAHKLMEVAKRFHLGEKTGIETPEVTGYVPTPDQAVKIPTGRIANFCIGQELTVTPIQMACFVSCIANGGKLFYPRVMLDHRAPEEPFELATRREGNLHDIVKINPHHLQLLHEAMRLDTENPEANAYLAFHGPGLEPLSFQVAGKTGTAEIKRPGVKDKTTWFVSYAPVDRPKWAVVVVVENGISGGKTCAEAARKIYLALESLEKQQQQPRTVALNFEQQSRAREQAVYLTSAGPAQPLAHARGSVDH